MEAKAKVLEDKVKKYGLAREVGELIMANRHNGMRRYEASAPAGLVVRVLGGDGGCCRASTKSCQACISPECRRCRRAHCRRTGLREQQPLQWMMTMLFPMQGDAKQLRENGITAVSTLMP